MLRPLSDDEKKDVLRQMVQATIEETKRRGPELLQIKQAAQTLFWEFVKQPVLHIEEAEMPSSMTAPPVEELWSVQPKVTIE